MPRGVADGGVAGSRIGEDDGGAGGGRAEFVEGLALAHSWSPDFPSMSLIFCKMSAL